MPTTENPREIGLTGYSALHHKARADVELSEVWRTPQLKARFYLYSFYHDVEIVRTPKFERRVEGC